MKKSPLNLEIVRLYEHEGLDWKAISDKLGCSRKHVCRIITRARRNGQITRARPEPSPETRVRVARLGWQAAGGVALSRLGGLSHSREHMSELAR